MAYSNEMPEYIQDCEPYWLAVKIGILGVIIGIIATLIYESIMIIYIDASNFNPTLLSDLLAIQNALGFAGKVLGSVGFLGVFSMKRSILGLVFPLKYIASIFISSAMYWIVVLGGFSFSEISISVQVVFGYFSAFIGGLALLIIRKKSADSSFLIAYAILYMFGGLLSNLVFQLIFGSSFPISTGFEHFITSLPSLILGLFMSSMNIIFFYLEGRAGCIDVDEFQAEYIA